MLVIDRQVDPEGLLATAALPKVAIVDFDSETDPTRVLIAKIQDVYTATGSTQFKAVAFANHGGDIWQLATDCKVEVGQEGYIATILPVMSVLADCVMKGGRIDLLGCNLLAQDPNLPDKLEEKFVDIKFTASDDQTGKPQAGGDWVMESAGLDISMDYFDSDKLKAYNGLMWSWWDTIDMIPLVGTVARGGQAAVLLAQGDIEGAKEAGANAGMNLAGDALGLVTGGTGKIAMTGAVAAVKAGARAGVKAVAKQGLKQGSRAAAKEFFKAAAKAAGKGFIQGVKKNLTKSFCKRYAKKYLKKKIKKSTKKALKDVWTQAKEMETVPDDMGGVVDSLAEATGMSAEEIMDLPPSEILSLWAALAELPDDDDLVEQ